MNDITTLKLLARSQGILFTCSHTHIFEKKPANPPEKQQRRPSSLQPLWLLLPDSFPAAMEPAVKNLHSSLDATPFKCACLLFSKITILYIYILYQHICVCLENRHQQFWKTHNELAVSTHEKNISFRQIGSSPQDNGTRELTYPTKREKENHRLKMPFFDGICEFPEG